jgi:hypothetical protein
MSRRLAVLAVLISAATLTACSIAPQAAKPEGAGAGAPAAPGGGARVASTASTASAGTTVDYFGRPCRYENFHVKPQPCLFPRRP